MVAGDLRGNLRRGRVELARALERGQRAGVSPSDSMRRAIRNSNSACAFGSAGAAAVCPSP